jgi:hypothetical protein
MAPLRSLVALGVALALAAPADAGASRSSRKRDEAGSASGKRHDAKRPPTAAKTAASAGKQPRRDKKRASAARGKRASRTSAPARARASVASAPRYLPAVAAASGPIHCPSDMVAVAGRVCVDRFEATLIDADSNATLSPYYPPSRDLAASLFDTWSRARDAAPESTLARLMPVPAPWPGDPPAFVRPRATSVAMSVPNGYVNGLLAGEACRAAGKRLCTDTEWRTACRGEWMTQFPYGTQYEQGSCNVFREAHPSQSLHGSAAHHHHDPRLNQMTSDGAPLLRPTGATSRCASRWGADVIYDMVGNLDEWIEDPEGTFLGGFYSRATRAGCEARIGGHPIDYFDYSTGVRCCKDPD